MNFFKDYRFKRIWLATFLFTDANKLSCHKARKRYSRRLFFDKHDLLNLTYWWFIYKQEYINLWTSKSNMKGIYKGNSLLLIHKIKVIFKSFFQLRGSFENVKHLSSRTLWGNFESSFLMQNSKQPKKIV
jgi:hypothetical protein